MAAAIAKATEAGAISVVGGGDTATAAKKFKVVDKVSHASTAAALRSNSSRARSSRALPT